MEVQMQDVNITINGGTCHNVMGCETVTITTNSLTKETLEVFTGMIKELMEQNSKLTNKLCDKMTEIAEYKLQIAQYERELRELKKDTNLL